MQLAITASAHVVCRTHCIELDSVCRTEANCAAYSLQHKLAARHCIMVGPFACHCCLCGTSALCMQLSCNSRMASPSSGRRGPGSLQELLAWPRDLIRQLDLGEDRASTLRDNVIGGLSVRTHYSGCDTPMVCLAWIQQELAKTGPSGHLCKDNFESLKSSFRLASKYSWICSSSDV